MSSPYTSGSASPRVGSSANLSQYASDAPARSPEEEAAERLIAQNTAAAQEKTEPVGNPIYPILAYCGSSIAMTVINKYCVSGAGFSMNFLLLSIQSVVALIAVVIAKRAGIITFRDFDVADAKAWFPISALLVAVIYTGSKSLQGLSIPAYTVLKNGAIILTAYGEVIWFGGHVTSLALCSFLLMIFSSVLSSWPAISYSIGWSDVAIAGRDSQTMGFVWMTLNCFATATYLLTMRKRIKVTGFKDWDSMMYNNLLSIPILLLASILFEDWGAASLARNFPAENRHVLLTAIAVSGAAAVFISYSTAWCIRVTSSTTYSMVGALNKLPIAASGMVFFADPVNFSSVGSVLMGFFAGLVYSAAKNQQAKDAKAAASNAIPMYNTDKAKA